MTQPVRRVVLLGAARSGTKVLREALAEATDAGKVPYDVPFVWYQGAKYPDSDVLDARRLRPGVASRIRDYIDSYAAGDPLAVIEKTVGNTLRVPFVDAVFPGAVYVHLVRDGVDVTESTFRQWQAPADVGYLRDKLRHTPKRVLPTYGARYVRSALGRMRGDAVRTWGVRYPGMQGDLDNDGLLRVCARQWQLSVEWASADLVTIDAEQIEVRYETLVADPAGTIAGVASACGLTAQSDGVAAAAARISTGTIGRGRLSLSEEQRAVVQEEVGTTLALLGYPSANTPEKKDPHARP